MTKLARTTLLLALVACCAAGCGRAPGRRRSAFTERLPRVEVVQPTNKRLIRRLETSATVEALKRVELSARVPGVVRDLDDKVDIGFVVKKDQVLLRLHVPELEADKAHKEALLEQARKQEKAAGAALEVAKREVEESRADEKKYKADVEYQEQRYSRIASLVRQRAQDEQVEQEALKQLQSAKAALASNAAAVTKREAKVEAARADIELATQRIRAAEADVRRVAELIGFATVKAPFDGVITKRWVDPGAIIKDPGATLLTVMQMDRVRVLIDVPQRDVPYLNAREQNPNPDGRGDPVAVRMPSLKEVVKDGTFEGYITRVSRSLDPVTRTMRAEIELENKDLLLRPGMFGAASVLVEDRWPDRTPPLTLPAAALMRRNEGVVEVFQVTGVQGEGEERRGVLKRVPVVLGIDDGKEVEIREGLKGDELIVARVTGVMRADEAVLAVSDREALADR
jgi:RND family efflux transporter MFP subunit